VSIPLDVEWYACFGQLSGLRESWFAITRKDKGIYCPYILSTVTRQILKKSVAFQKKYVMMNKIIGYNK